MAPPTLRYIYIFTLCAASSEWRGSSCVSTAVDWLVRSVGS